MKKYLISFALIAAALVPSFAAAQTATSAADIQYKIQLLLAQIQSLQNSIQSAKHPAFCHSFSTDLQFGNRGVLTNANDDMTALQAVLQKEGFAIDASETKGVSIFGESTSAAVVQFQGKYGIRQSGYVGPLTRTKLNALYNCGTGTAVVGVSASSTGSSSGSSSVASGPLQIIAPAASAALSSGTSAKISWTPFAGTFDSYQVVVGNFQTGSERQLYDRVSPIDYLPSAQTSFQWNVPDLVTDFSKGTGYSADQIRNSFYLKVNAVKNDAAGARTVSSSPKQSFISSAASTATSTVPSIYLGAADGIQNDVGGAITARVGDTVVISGIPQGLAGLAYGAAGYTMSWNFDSSLSNACSSSLTSATGRWALTCVPSATGIASIYAVINRNGIAYRSNTITLSILASSYGPNAINLITPNGGQYFPKSQPISIQWNGGAYPVEVGVVSSGFPNDKTVVGWIQQNGGASGTIAWDVNHVTLSDTAGTNQQASIPAGDYKILVVSKNPAGIYCYGQNSSQTGCVYDASDSSFTVGN